MNDLKQRISRNAFQTETYRSTRTTFDVNLPNVQIVARQEKMIPPALGQFAHLVVHNLPPQNFRSCHIKFNFLLFSLWRVKNSLTIDKFSQRIVEQ